MNKPLPIILCGASGRMGQKIITEAHGSGNVHVIAAVTRRPELDGLGASIPCFPSLDKAAFGVKDAVVIDFSLHTEAQANLDAAVKHSLPILIATTGHDATLIAHMKQAASTIAVLYAPNTSMLANLLMHLSAVCAQALPQAEIRLLDIHHRHKKDAPSGTVQAMVQAMKRAAPTNAELTNPHLVTSLRVGDEVGKHVVTFYQPNEQLELKHEVMDRRVFAQGALVAAGFLYGQKPGLYDMAHVLKITAHP